MLYKIRLQNIYEIMILFDRRFLTFYTMTNSLPTLSITTDSSYNTTAWTLKSAALLALILYLKINCLGSLVTFSV